MLTLFYAPGACSLAAHIVLEESGEKYEARKVDLAKGEQKTAEYLKIHPLGRVPALRYADERRERRRESRRPVPCLPHEDGFRFALRGVDLTRSNGHRPRIRLKSSPQGV